MRWFGYIWILLVVYMISSARTCNENEEVTEKQKEEYTRNLMSNVKQIFTSDTLSDYLLRGYEKTAVSKLVDFADYMNIISDTVLDMRLRQHTAELVKGLFVKDEIEFHNLSKIYSEAGLNNLELLLDHTISGKNSICINPGQIIISGPFARINDSTYVGHLSFVNEPVLTGGMDLPEIEAAEFVIDIYLVKKLRFFGEEQIRAWDVYLGDMR